MSVKRFCMVTTQSVSEPCFGVFEYDFQFIKKCLQLLDQHLCQFVNVSPDLLRSCFSIRHNGCDDCAATPWPHSFCNSWWSRSCLPHCLITSSPGQCLSYSNVQITHVICHLVVSELQVILFVESLLSTAPRSSLVLQKLLRRLFQVFAS